MSSGPVREVHPFPGNTTPGFTQYTERSKSQILVLKCGDKVPIIQFKW